MPISIPIQNPQAYALINACRVEQTYKKPEPHNVWNVKSAKSLLKQGLNALIKQIETNQLEQKNPKQDLKPDEMEILTYSTAFNFKGEIVIICTKKFGTPNCTFFANLAFFDNHSEYLRSLLYRIDNLSDGDNSFTEVKLFVPTSFLQADVIKNITKPNNVIFTNENIRLAQCLRTERNTMHKLNDNGYLILSSNNQSTTYQYAAF